MSQNNIPDWKGVGKGFLDPNAQETKPANYVEQNPPQIPIGGEVKKDLDKGVTIERRANEGTLAENKRSGAAEYFDWITPDKNASFGAKTWQYTKNIGKAAAITVLTPLAALTGCSKADDVNPGVGVNVNITPEKITSDTIWVLGMEKYFPDGHQTKDGVKFEYKLDDNKKPYAEFENGLKHYIGDDVNVSRLSTTGILYDMFDKVGLGKPDKNTKIITDINANQGSYGNDDKGFAMSLVTPADLKEITSGNPQIKGNIGEYNFDGKAVKDDKTGDIVIKNKNGEEVRLSYQDKYDVGTKEYPDVYDGLVVSVNGKDTYFMTDLGNGAPEIGIIDHENGTFLQHYPPETKEFDADTNVDQIYMEWYDKVKNGYTAEGNAWVNIH